MAHKKGGGSTRNGRDSNSQRLGVKKFGGELVLVAQLDRRIDCRMHDDAAGERLVSIERRFVTLAEIAGDLIVVLLGRDRIGPAALSLQHLV